MAKAQPEPSVRLTWNDLYKCSDCNVENSDYIQYVRHRMLHSKLSTHKSKAPYLNNLAICPLVHEKGKGKQNASNRKHILFSDSLSENLSKEEAKWNELRLGHLKHQCEICMVLFSSFAAYKLHLKNHTGSCLSCPHCPKKFTRPYRMEEHIQRVHMKFSLGYSCDICNKVYSWKQSLLAHKKLHTEECPSCPHCNIKFITITKVNAHIKLVHERKGPIFRCDICKKEFFKERNFITHKRIHTNEGLSCPHCDRKYLRRSELNDHIEIIHINKGKGFLCDHCPKVFSGRQSLKLHLKIHSGKCEICTHCGSKFTTIFKLRDHVERMHEKRKTSVSGAECEQKKQCLICPHCSKKYIRLAKLKEHIEKMHCSQSTVPCEICSKPFGTSSELQHHRNVHEEECSLCPYCDEQFYLPNKLEEHIDAVHTSAEKKYKCNICGKILNTMPNLKLHKRLHTDRCSPCPKCDQKFVRPSLLKQHLKTHVTDDGPFICLICEKFFKHEHLLTLHNRIHTGDCFSCDQCDMKFPRRFKLVKHIAIAHDESYNKFTCDQCPKVFARPETLRAHKKIHTENCLKCSYCDKKFVRPYVLREHVERFHVNQSQGFKCDFCPKIFTRKYTLRMHSRVHTGDCFKCNDCDKQYVRIADLNDHYDRIHVNENKGYKCETCGKTFARSDSLKMHSKLHTSQCLECPHCEKKFARCSEFNVHIERVHGNIAPEPL